MADNQEQERREEEEGEHPTPVPAPPSPPPARRRHHHHHRRHLHHHQQHQQQQQRHEQEEGGLLNTNVILGAFISWALLFVSRYFNFSFPVRSLFWMTTSLDYYHPQMVLEHTSRVVLCDGSKDL